MSKRQLQGLIKQRFKTTVTIFRLSIEIRKFCCSLLLFSDAFASVENMKSVPWSQVFIQSRSLRLCPRQIMMCMRWWSLFTLCFLTVGNLFITVKLPFNLLVKETVASIYLGTTREICFRRRHYGFAIFAWAVIGHPTSLLNLRRAAFI